MTNKVKSRTRKLTGGKRRRGKKRDAKLNSGRSYTAMGIFITVLVLDFAANFTLFLCVHKWSWWPTLNIMELEFWKGVTQFTSNTLDLLLLSVLRTVVVPLIVYLAIRRKSGSIQRSTIQSEQTKPLLGEGCHSCNLTHSRIRCYRRASDNW